MMPMLPGIPVGWKETPSRCLTEHKEATVRPTFLLASASVVLAAASLGATARGDGTSGKAQIIILKLDDVTTSSGC
jgi:hypothetical protein